MRSVKIGWVVRCQILPILVHYCIVLLKVLATFSHALTVSGAHSFLCNWQIVGDTLMVVWRHVGLTARVFAIVEAPKIIQAVQCGCVVGARGILLLRTSMTRISAVWLKRNVLKRKQKQFYHNTSWQFIPVLVMTWNYMHTNISVSKAYGTSNSANTNLR